MHFSILHYPAKVTKTFRKGPDKSCAEQSAYILKTYAEKPVSLLLSCYKAGIFKFFSLSSLVFFYRENYGFYGNILRNIVSKGHVM